MSAAQRQALADEGQSGPAERPDTLVRAAQSAIDRALNQIRTTPLCTLDEARESAVIGSVHRAGSLVHAAEHAQRHPAQIITTAKII